MFKASEIQGGKIEKATAQVLIVGLGPYGVFTHLNNLLLENIKPCVVVELESRGAGTKIILQTLGLKDVEIVLVPDLNRDQLELDQGVKTNLDRVIDEKKISHVLISTEPKAHYSYLKYFIEKRIPVFCDKPIIALASFSTDLQVSRKSFDMYKELMQLSEENSVPVYINRKRREHSGYQFIRNLIHEVSLEYGLAPTSLEISASDGMWNFPKEFVGRENHPYKYGYGKLLHSGYHFVDLISYLLEKSVRKIHGQELSLMASSYCFRPNDMLEVMDDQFYGQFFKGADFQKDIFEAKKIDNFGELDVFSNLRIANSQKVPVTHVSMNLMNTSFSRRSWADLPFDTYKGNGRVRHERMSLQIGPLLNIQFHEYGTLELDQNGGPYPISEILVFRNKALIGGEAFQRIKSTELDAGSSQTEEQKSLKRFIDKGPSVSMIRDHCWSQELLSKFAESIVSDYKRSS